MAKYHDEEWLEEKLENNTPQEVADECGVQKGTIFKWRKKLGVGETFECDYCDEEFPTERGLNIHHKKEHDQSTDGFTYECEECGDEFKSSRAPEDDKAPRFCGQECYGTSISGEDNPNKDPERKKKISETMKEVHREGSGNYGDRDRQWMMDNVINKRDDEYLYEGNPVIDDHLISTPKFVEQTGHTVRSSWEKDIDLMLYKSGINYEYEPTRFDIGDRKYMPDFVVDDKVVEVKGYVDGKAADKAEMFMDEYPEFEYIVVGSKIPCDIHIPWEDREELISNL